MPDLIAETGLGRATQVRVLDGVDGEQLYSVAPFEATFTGGEFVALGDVDGDGKSDSVITTDEGGGPRARVFSGNDFRQINDFFGIEDITFGGGARAAFGDINRDGILDLLVVGAGDEAGSRLTRYLGKEIEREGTPPEDGFFDAFLGFDNGIFVG